MSPKKRKRSNSIAPIAPSVECKISYHAGDRVFARLFDEKSLDETKRVVRKKLKLADDVELSLAQMRNGHVIDLEDDDDFKAFTLDAQRSESLDVRVTLENGLQNSSAATHKSASDGTAVNPAAAQVSSLAPPEAQTHAHEGGQKPAGGRKPAASSVLPQPSSSANGDKTAPTGRDKGKKRAITKPPEPAAAVPVEPSAAKPSAVHPAPVAPSDPDTGAEPPPKRRKLKGQPAATDAASSTLATPVPATTVAPVKGRKSKAKADLPEAQTSVPAPSPPAAPAPAPAAQSTIPVAILALDDGSDDSEARADKIIAMYRASLEAKEAKANAPKVPRSRTVRPKVQAETSSTSPAVAVVQSPAAEEREASTVPKAPTRGRKKKESEKESTTGATGDVVPGPEVPTAAAHDKVDETAEATETEPPVKGKGKRKTGEVPAPPVVEIPTSPKKTKGEGSKGKQTEGAKSKKRATTEPPEEDARPAKRTKKSVGPVSTAEADVQPPAGAEQTDVHMAKEADAEQHAEGQVDVGASGWNSTKHSDANGGKTGKPKGKTGAIPDLAGADGATQRSLEESTPSRDAVNAAGFPVQLPRRQSVAPVTSTPHAPSLSAKTAPSSVLVTPTVVQSSAQQQTSSPALSSSSKKVLKPLSTHPMPSVSSFSAPTWETLKDSLDSAYDETSYRMSVGGSSMVDELESTQMASSPTRPLPEVEVRGTGAQLLSSPERPLAQLIRNGATVLVPETSEVEHDDDDEEEEDADEDESDESEQGSPDDVTKAGDEGTETETETESDSESKENVHGDAPVSLSQALTEIEEEELAEEAEAEEIAGARVSDEQRSTTASPGTVSSRRDQAKVGVGRARSDSSTSLRALASPAQVPSPRAPVTARTPNATLASAREPLSISQAAPTTPRPSQGSNPFTMPKGTPLYLLSTQSQSQPAEALSQPSSQYVPLSLLTAEALRASMSKGTARTSVSGGSSQKEAAGKNKAKAGDEEEEDEEEEDESSEEDSSEEDSGEEKRPSIVPKERMAGAAQLASKKRKVLLGKFW